MALNQEQQDAVSLLHAHAAAEFERGEKLTVLNLCGAAGTGKTHTARALIESLRSLGLPSPVQGCAPTHQAKRNLSKSLGTPCRTIHSLLGLRLDKQLDGESELCEGSQQAPLRDGILLIDEAGMVGKDLIENLSAKIHRFLGAEKTIVVNLYDKYQLYPVGESDFPVEGLAEKLGCREAWASLVTPVRYLNSPSRPLIEEIRAEVDKQELEDGGKYRLPSLGYLSKYSGVSDEGYCRVLTSHSLWLEKLIASYRWHWERRKLYEISTISLTHKKRMGINALIRSELGLPDGRYAEDEILITRETISNLGEIVLPVHSRVCVDSDLGLGEIELDFPWWNHGSVRTQKIKTIEYADGRYAYHLGGEKFFNVVAPCDLEKWQLFLATSKKQCQEKELDWRERYKIISEADALEPAFATTINAAQGVTTPVNFVAHGGMFQARQLYTAVSRTGAGNPRCGLTLG